MASRFLQLVGSLPLEEQKLWLPNQLAHAPDSWTVPHLLSLKMDYPVLVNTYGCEVQEMFTVEDHPPPLLMNLSYYRLSISFTRFMYEIRSCLSQGILKTTTGSVGLILAKALDMRISIPLDSSSRSCSCHVVQNDAQNVSSNDFVSRYKLFCV